MVRARLQALRHVALIFISTLTVTAFVQAQVTVNNDSLPIPAAVRVDRDGRQPLPDVDRAFFLDEWEVGDVGDVFQAPPCLPGEYYAGFQSLYDLRS